MRGFGRVSDRGHLQISSQPLDHVVLVIIMPDSEDFR